MARDPFEEWWQRPLAYLRFCLSWVLIGFLIRIGWTIAGWVGF